MSTVFLLKPDQKILFIGDSITAAGKNNSGSSPSTGYVSIVQDWLLARYPEYNFEIVNKGISGNTVRDLKGRWDKDVLKEKPSVLSVMIGINDFGAFADGKPKGVSVEEYEDIYRELLTDARSDFNPQLILMDPYIFRTRQEEYRDLMDKYIEVVHKLVSEFNAISVRTQDAFDRGLAEKPFKFWGRDRCHPYSHGHAVIARAFLKSIGYEF